MYKDKLSKSDPYADFFDVRPRPKGAKPAIYPRKDTKESLYKKLRKELKIKFLNTSYQKLYPFLAFLGTILKGIFFAVFFPPYFLLIVGPRWIFKKAIPKVYEFFKRQVNKVVSWFVNPIKAGWTNIVGQFQTLKTRFKEAKKRLDEETKKKPLPQFMLIEDFKKKWSINKEKLFKQTVNARKHLNTLKKQTITSIQTQTQETKQFVARPFVSLSDSLKKALTPYWRSLLQNLRKAQSKYEAGKKAINSQIEAFASSIQRKITQYKTKLKQKLTEALQPIVSPIRKIVLKIKNSTRAALQYVLSPLSQPTMEVVSYIKKGYGLFQNCKHSLIQMEYQFRKNLRERLWKFPKKAAAAILRFCEKVAWFYRLVIKPPLDLFDYLVEIVVKPIKKALIISKSWIAASCQQLLSLVKRTINKVLAPIKRLFSLIGRGLAHVIYVSRLGIVWTIVLYEYGMELVQARAERVLS